MCTYLIYYWEVYDFLCLFVSLLLIIPFKDRTPSPVPSLLILHRRLMKVVLRGMYWVRK
jgi:hypothetical protein